jgi:hypothetical protein
MKANNSVLDAVRKSYTDDSRESLESVLKSAGVISNADKAATILNAMGVDENGEVYYSGDAEEPCSDEERYEALVGTFFSGAWIPGTV